MTYKYALLYKFTDRFSKKVMEISLSVSYLFKVFAHIHKKLR